MRYQHILELGIIAVLMASGVGALIAMTPDPQPGGWQRVCTRHGIETTTSLIPGGVTSSLVFGAIPLGNGLGLKTETNTVCQHYAWQCPAGARCDARLKPAETP